MRQPLFYGYKEDRNGLRDEDSWHATLSDPAKFSDLPAPFDSSYAVVDQSSTAPQGTTSGNMESRKQIMI